jgi:hypothetical protein
MNNAADNAVDHEELDDDLLITDELEDSLKAKPAEEEDDEELSFADQVNANVAKLVEGEDGKWTLPESEKEKFTPEMKFAVISEKRRRDAQSALGRAQHAESTIKLENESLKGKLKSNAQVVITAEEQEELAELKFSDPDAWREKLNEYEQRAAQQVETELEEVSSEITDQSELKRREAVLKQFNEENSDFLLTDEIINDDVPPRIVNKLKAGEVTFEAFLDEVKTYLMTGKAVKDGKVLDQPDLGDIGGTSTASDEAVTGDMVGSYESEIY